MNISVLNGPNLHLLGTREPEVYGHRTLAEIEALCRARAASLGVTLAWSQTNHEGTIEQKQGCLLQKDHGQT